MSAPVRAELTSVIVVAADSGPLLGACIDSALGTDAAVEVLLVDNASADGEVERAISTHTGDARLRVLRNPANLGFGPACNRGAAIANGDFLLFLNPDCVLRPDTVVGLRDRLSGRACIGVLGVTVCDPEGTPARGNRRREPTLRRALLSISGLSRFAARWPALAGLEMMVPVPAREACGSGAESQTIEIVDAISGACMMLPREAFDAIGGFDEAYFLHVEDLDLCRRVRDSGRVVAIAPQLRVTHAQGSSSHQRPVFVARHKHRGMWRYFRRFDPAARNVLLRALVWCGVWAHFAVQAPVLALRTSPRKQ